MLTAEQTFFADIVHRESGIVLGEEKGYLLDTRLAPLVKELGCADLKEFHGKVRTNLSSDLRRKVVEALTTNESLFFRDMTPFKILQSELIPKFRASRNRPIRIWCAAASTGQEPYSIAMSFLENWPGITPGELSITATDLNTEVLEKAKRGTYSQLEVNRGLPILMLTRHFRQDGTTWLISDRVKAFVTWNILNLIQPFALPGSFDVIFIRNVLIYFNEETKRRILERCSSFLRPDGVLFLGSSETTLGITNLFGTRNGTSGGIYYQVTENTANSMVRK